MAVTGDGDVGPGSQLAAAEVALSPEDVQDAADSRTGDRRQGAEVRSQRSAVGGQRSFSLRSLSSFAANPCLSSAYFAWFAVHFLRSLRLFAANSFDGGSIALDNWGNT